MKKKEHDAEPEVEKQDPDKKAKDAERLNFAKTLRGPCPDCGLEVNGWYDFLVHLITCGTLH